ncbi:uncharacterized protein B0H64DRAFT_468014 [Chaetomium fimeti]|uniref:Uncharacterized protein n=1 Tax=Chaetomium fimeti TaxID=1854472 RepID=A0AAE0H9Y6_9PEZI|nr:hypothetical protein B0H64DRAFT_468014 [Chaetomium fimeti]
MLLQRRVCVPSRPSARRQWCGRQGSGSVRVGCDCCTVQASKRNFGIVVVDVLAFEAVSPESQTTFSKTSAVYVVSALQSLKLRRLLTAIIPRYRTTGRSLTPSLDDIIAISAPKHAARALMMSGSIGVVSHGTHVLQVTQYHQSSVRHTTLSLIGKPIRIKSWSREPGQMTDIMMGRMRPEPPSPREETRTKEPGSQAARVTRRTELTARLTLNLKMQDLGRRPLGQGSDHSAAVGGAIDSGTELGVDQNLERCSSRTLQRF